MPVGRRHATLSPLIPLSEVPHVIVFALCLAGLLLVWVSLTYVDLRKVATRYPWAWSAYLPAVFASAFSLEVTLVGLAGVVLGMLGGSIPVAVAYGLVALAAGIPVVRIWRTPEVLTEAFGSALPPEADRRYLLQQPWGLHLHRVPEARLQRDIPFWTPPGSARPLLCDIWQPPAEVVPSGLAFIYFHGSAWTLLDKDVGTRPLFRHLAAQGHVVMDVAYRLFPETGIEGMVGDVRRSIAWLKANAMAYGVRPDRIVIGGASAGGHIAMLAAYTEGHPDLTPPDTRGVDTSVRGVLSWYGPVDLPALYRRCDIAKAAVTMPNQPDWNAPAPQLMRRLMGRGADRLGFQKGPAAGRLDWIIGGSPEQEPERYALLSPITHVSADCPPTLMMQGPGDIIVPLASVVEACKRLRQAGAKAVLLVLPQSDHAFDLFGTNWSPSARKALWHAERFLALMAD